MHVRLHLLWYIYIAILLLLLLWKGGEYHAVTVYHTYENVGLQNEDLVYILRQQ